MRKIILSMMLCIMAAVALAQPPQDTTKDHHRHHGAPNGEHRGPEKNPFFMDPLFKRFMVKGYAQGGYTFQQDPKSNTFDMKRAYIFCRAQITDRWYFWFMYDFCGVVNEYYLDFAAVLGGKLNLRMGEFKHPFALENPYSPTKQELIDVYAQGTVYLAGCGSDPLYGVQYGRDLGAMAYGDLADKHFHYELAILNGQGINTKDRNNKKDFAARLEVLPSEKLKIVASGQTGYGNALPNSTRPFIYTPNINPGDDYERHRWAFGMEFRSTGHINNSADYWHIRPVVVRTEYLGGNDGGNMSDGAYITFTVPLAKEFDIVGSYDYFNYNKDIAGFESTKYIVGLQYWFYKLCRLQAQYIYTNSTGNVGGYSSVMLQTQFAF